MSRIPVNALIVTDPLNTMMVYLSIREMKSSTAFMAFYPLLRTYGEGFQIYPPCEYQKMVNTTSCDKL